MGTPSSDNQDSSPARPLPAAPNPGNDPGLVPSIGSPPPDDGSTPEDLDIFTMTPMAALKLLCRSIDSLVQLTGDVPPTPPVRSRAASPAGRELRDKENGAGAGTPVQSPGGGDHIDGVPFYKTPIGSPEAHLSEESTPKTRDIGAHAQPISIQHGAIARKFYSKRPPAISATDYLLRLHKYCPQSTAVYLATSAYITRLAGPGLGGDERAVPLTPRTVHRLLLAALRVAMKALEDRSWPHARFAKVGGVDERELARLEIAFCFLINFELRVDEPMLVHELHALARPDAVLLDGGPLNLDLHLPLGRPGSGKPEKRKASSALPCRPALHVPATS